VAVNLSIYCRQGRDGTQYTVEIVPMDLGENTVCPSIIYADYLTRGSIALEGPVDIRAFEEPS